MVVVRVTAKECLNRIRFAAILFMSGALLLYTALVVPIQILVWDYSDPCNKFPTLYFDVAADSFFLVIH